MSQHKALYIGCLLVSTIFINSIAMEDQEESRGTVFCNDLDRMQNEGVASCDGDFIATCSYERLVGWGGFYKLTPEIVKQNSALGNYPWELRVNIYKRGRLYQVGFISSSYTTLHAIAWTPENKLRLLWTKIAKSKELQWHDNTYWPNGILFREGLDLLHNDSRFSKLIQ